MKKLFLITLTLFILSSCLVVSRNDVKTSEKPIVEVEEIIVEEKNNTGEIIEKQSNSGELLNSEIKELEKKEVLTIEEQYCLSKGGKLVPQDDLKICYTTDEKGLLKCEVKIFYFDMCRSKTAIVKNGIVIAMPKKIIEKPKVKEELVDTGSLKFELEVETENDEEEIEKESKNEILEEENIVKTTIVKELQGKSGKYFILVGDDGSTDFRMITNDGSNISLYKGNHNDGENRVVIYDYELMINKQIKVFYRGPEDEKLEKIIDLNNL